MDPISAIAAASSVVGIASFGLQLSQTLYQFISEARDAHYSIHAVVDGVNATTAAMNQVRSFLDEERDNVESGGKTVLFSDKALRDVKNALDHCLALFWRIECTLLNKPSPKQIDEEIKKRLDTFNKQIIEKKNPETPTLNENLVLKRLRKFEYLRWPYFAPKLEHYSIQLNRLQINLILMFQVISIRAISRKG
jgi:hypothetical protein